MGDPAIETLQRRLAQNGALLLFVGLLTGGFAGGAMTGQIPADGHAALAAHLNALLGSFWIFAFAWTLRWQGWSPVALRRIAFLLVGSNWANWLLTVVKATLRVAGLGFDQNPANNAMFVLLNACVVLPALVAAGAWAWGFRVKPAPAPSAELSS